MLTHLFTTLVRPILEYNNSIWGPHYILDNRKVEKIQRRATRLTPLCHNKSYTERLTQLNLPSLHRRRLRGDLIFLFKILNNYLQLIFLIYIRTQDVLPGDINSLTNYLRNANSLPNYVVNASSINAFKSLLDRYLIDLKFIFCMIAVLIGNTGYAFSRI